MTPQQLYTPRDTAERVGISASYLRQLASSWADHLSDYANPTGGDPRSRRRSYTAQDVATLGAILDLQRRGVEDADIPAQLAVDPPTVSQETPDAPLSPDSAGRALMALTGAIATDQAARLAALESQVADLRVQVATLAGQLETLTAAQHDHPGIVPTRRGARTADFQLIKTDKLKIRHRSNTPGR